MLLSICRLIHDIVLTKILPNTIIILVPSIDGRDAADDCASASTKKPEKGCLSVIRKDVFFRVYVFYSSSHLYIITKHPSIYIYSIEQLNLSENTEDWKYKSFDFVSKSE